MDQLQVVEMEAPEVVELVMEDLPEDLAGDLVELALVRMMTTNVQIGHIKANVKRIQVLC